MTIMGHSSLDIVLTYYHVTEEQLLASATGLSFASMLADTATALTGGSGGGVSVPNAFASRNPPTT